MGKKPVEDVAHQDREGDPKGQIGSGRIKTDIYGAKTAFLVGENEARLVTSIYNEVKGQDPNQSNENPY